MTVISRHVYFNQNFVEVMIKAKFSHLDHLCDLKMIFLTSH